MKKFLFLIREDLSKIRKSSEEELYEDIRKMDEWVKALVQSGNYLFGDGLLAVGKYVSKDHVLSDGPFIEAKEAVSGYVFMQAKDINDAASIAQTCPHVIERKMIIEIRPVMGLKDIRELGDEKRATSSK
ncbi:MAG TPA: YciI family protein [Chitinophagaceae bacterium]|jgi:hypothetical protein|nr:YciI family protein [Chitinophagaceae bacterium]